MVISSYMVAVTGNRLMALSDTAIVTDDTESVLGGPSAVQC